MNCQHCTRKLTPITTFGDPGECLCQECWFELLDLRIELRDAKTELSQAIAVVQAFSGEDNVPPEKVVAYYNAVAERDALECNVQLLQGAVEKFNRYAKETP